MVKKTEIATKPGFKKTKVGWIPEDWSYEKIGSSSSIDKKSLSSKTDPEYSFNYISLSDIENGRINYVNRQTFKSSPSRARRIVSRGDVLIATVRPNLQSFGIVEQESHDLIASTGFAVVSCNKELNSKFLFFCLFSHSMKAQFYALVVGSNYPAINSKDVKNLRIPLPPLPEQRKIAEILSTWDKAIEQKQDLIEKLKTRKKGLMQQLLTGKTRLDGFSGEWKEEKLGKYFSQRNEINNINLPLLSVGINGVYPQDNSNKKDTSNADKSKYKRICIGDIGYNTMRMWQGRSALSDMEGIVSPAYTIVTPKQNSDPLFFSYLFKLEKIIHRFYRNSQGLVSDTWQCRFKDFSMVKVRCPKTLKEQQAIASVLTTADNEIKAHEAHLSTLQSQKKGLMQQLLTGEKRVEI